MRVQLALCQGAVFRGKDCPMILCRELCRKHGVWVVELSRPKEACIKYGAHWRSMTVTIVPSMCGSDAAFLSDYFDQLLLVLLPPLLLLAGID